MFFEGDSYRFFARRDDGARVWIDDQLIIDDWHDSDYPSESADLFLSAGPHTIRIEILRMAPWRPDEILVGAARTRADADTDACANSVVVGHHDGDKRRRLLQV